MKKTLFVTFALASILFASCVSNHCCGEKCEKDCDSNSGKGKTTFLTPAKKPGVKESQIKKDLNYELALKNDQNFVYLLPIGHFEVSPDQMEFLAALDANGLITLKSKSIKKSGANNENDNYSVWVDVELTSKGNRYIEKGQTYERMVNLDKMRYDRIINPARDRNAYGELEEEIAEDSVSELLRNFYLKALSSLENAVKAYGESEFIDTYDRVVKINSYLKVVAPGSELMNDDTFFAGVALDSEKINAMKVVRVTRYYDCYKVYLDDAHSVVFVLTSDHNKIFDVVCKMGFLDVQTIRTRNKQWTEEQIKQYAEMAAKPETPVQSEKDLGIEREWYAPGLTPVYQGDSSRYVYLREKKYEIGECVPILLYRNVVDKVYKIMVSSTPKVDNLGGENEKILTYDFSATAKAVVKKVDITPFQRVLQKYSLVPSVDENNVFEIRDVKLSYCDERGWFAEFSGRDDDKACNESYNSGDNSYYVNKIISSLFGDYAE